MVKFKTMDANEAVSLVSYKFSEICGIYPITPASPMAEHVDEMRSHGEVNCFSNLVDVIEGNCRIKQALIKDKRYPTLYLLPSAQTKDKNSVTPEQMKKLTDELKEEFDYIILDCPAGIEQGFKNAIAGADRALVVTTPEVSAIRDADRIIGLLEANEIGKTDLIVNRIRMDMVKKGDMMSIEDVVDILSIDLIGAVPDDENIVISTNQGDPLVGSDALAGRAYMNICKRIMGEEVPLLDLDVKNGFWAKLFKKKN